MPALPWTGRPSTLDIGRDAIWVDDLGLFVAVGEDYAAVDIVTTSPDGETWTGRGDPLASGGNRGFGYGIVWSADLNLLVLVGATSVTRALLVATSPDGVTWTPQTTPWDGTGESYAVEWSSSLGLFVAIGTDGAVEIVMTSPDGVTWTSRSTPFDGGLGYDVGYAPGLGRFVLSGIDATVNETVMISDDGTTWLTQVTPFDGGGVAIGVYWSAVLSAFVAGGSDASGVGSVMISADGIVWNPVSETPFNGGSGGRAFDANGRVIMLGQNASGTVTVIQTYDGAAWTAQIPAPYLGPSSVFGGAYSPGLDLALLVGEGASAADGDSVVSAAPVPDPPPPTPPINQRFYESPPWRFVLCDLEGQVLSFLEPIAMNRSVVFVLDAPAIIGFDVPSDYPEVNMDDSTTLYPLLSMNDKIVVGLRREDRNPGVLAPWVVRATGLIMQPNDEITPNTDAPVTHVSAFDAWQYWNNRPLLNNLGELPGPGGLSYTNTAAATILKDILTNAILGGPAGGPLSTANLYTDFGQSTGPGGGLFYDGNIDFATTPLVDINFRQGMSLGEAVTQLVEMGACDVILKPIWDPVNRPGLFSELYVYALAGEKQNEVVFSWDKPGRSLNGVSRLQDGYQMGNVIQYYAGQGGPPVDVQVDGTAIDHYGPYWQQEFYSGTESKPQYVETLAYARLQAAKAGKETSTFDVAPEWGPIPFVEYNLGDQVRVYASSALRQPIHPEVLDGEWVNMYRVYSIPVIIPDDATEIVSQLLLSAPSPLPEL